jgi:surfactin synthase thioesterase subunit
MPAKRRARNTEAIRIIGAALGASRAYRSWRAVRRRIASMAHRRAVAISRPAGLAAEASGHDTSASATASWAASSASPNRR